MAETVLSLNVEPLAGGQSQGEQDRQEEHTGRHCFTQIVMSNAIHTFEVNYALPLILTHLFIHLICTQVLPLCRGL